MNKEPIILIVDDSQVQLMLLQAMLEGTGYSTVTAKDGVEALDYLKSDNPPPVLILSDVVMPNMDGYELCVKVRDTYKNIPVLICTAYDDGKSLEKALNAGAADYTEKPFTKTKLLVRINNILEKQKAVTGLKKQLEESKERMKELNAFYRLSEIVERKGITFDEMYQSTAEILPLSWQYPEISCARITIYDKEFRTENYASSDWKQTSNIVVHNTVVGNVEVSYFEDKPFLKEERLLIDALAERLGRIAERKEMENKVKHLAMHDSLTKLPNRRYFDNSLLEVASFSKRQGQKFALLIIDVDNFKWINDSFGHDIGDAVLKKLSSLLKNNIRIEDIVARIGGDEFAIILRGIDNYESVIFSAHKILNLFQSPYNFNSVSVQISISVGIAFYPLSTDSVQTLYKHADLALYKAKNKGKNCVEVYSEEVKESYTRMSEIEYALQFAIEKNELSLFYQPIVDMVTNKILGVEALLRWHNDKLGNIDPLKFIYIAEKKGFINKIGLWAFNEACEQASAWKQCGIEKLFLAVNISPIQLEQKDFTSQISKIIEKYNIDPYQIEIELTESALKNEINYVSQQFQVLCKQIHVRLSIDDFGTGFSSLSRLSEFPVTR